MEQVSPYPDYVVQDLARSGIDVEDIQAKILGPAERQATNAPLGADGYVIPYFDIKGKRVPFYRVKLFKAEMRYKQVQDSNNYLYFPPRLPGLLPKAKFLLLTEGEKKAAAAVRQGIPAVAASGVDSWRTRTFVMPKDAKIGLDSQSRAVVRIAQGANLEEKFSTFAEGFYDLVQFLKQRDIPLLIAYDSDLNVQHFIKFEVQRAAAALAYELRAKGLTHNQVRQLILDPSRKIARDSWQDHFPDGKLGLDDYLNDPKLGSEALRELVYHNLAQRQAFPLHPDVKQFVQRKLQRPKIGREDMHMLSLAILSDLDAKGLRLLHEASDSLYYFDENRHRLYPVHFKEGMLFSQTPFGTKLYQDYSITPADNRLIQHFSAQFAGEPDVQSIEPERVMAIRHDTLYYQLNDGQVVKVNAHNISIVSNGTDEILFEAGRTKPIKASQMNEAIKEVAQLPMSNWWYEVLKEARFPDEPEDYSRKLVSLLYYISPWFFRWRGTQLPIEMTIGEAGSGKSTLYEIRLEIIEGQSKLRNAPSDLKGWAASVSNSGGLHVTDNLHMVNSTLHQELSDELCRVITATDPFIEQRKLYTNADVYQIPVKVTFALTAIEQPFKNKDIIQRSIIIKLDKGSGEVVSDGGWREHQINRFGGRSRWLAHHFLFMQKLWRVIDKKWDSRYSAKYRLVNVEQLLVLVAEAFGWDSSWIPDYINTSRRVKIVEMDAALQGLRLFTEYWRPQMENRRFTAKEIVHWAQGEEDFEKHPILTNGRSLGRYMETNKNTIAEVCLIAYDGNYQNKNHYILLPKPVTL